MIRFLENIKNLILKTRDLQYIGAANLVTKGISGLFWIYIATLMTVEAYGQVSYLIAIATMATRISLFGSAQTIIVYTAKKVAIQPPVFLITIILGIVSSIVTYFILNEIIVSIYIISSLIFDLGIASLLGAKLYKRYAQYFIVQKTISAVLALSLFFIIGPNGVILGIGISFLCLIPIIIKGFKKDKLDFSVLKSRRGFMINSYSMNIEKILSGQVDKIIIVPLLGFATLGNYHLGFQFLGLLLILPSLVYTYTLPRDASGIGTRRIKIMTILISVGFAILGITIAPIVLPIVFPQFEEVVEVIQILSIYIIPNSISTAFVSHYLGKEKSKVVIIGQSITVGIYILGIYTLGEIYGINGVAVSFVLSGVAQTVFYLVLKKFKSI
ncbi:MAG: lipopolysaccharide biosynthesis protein [Candidatus Nitrosopumilus sp. bin_32a]